VCGVMLVVLLLLSRVEVSVWLLLILLLLPYEALVQVLASLMWVR